jgi:adenine-specific DNA-methyltransferase
LVVRVTAPAGAETVPSRRKSSEKSVEDYAHRESTRLNNPEVGLARYETSPAPRVPFAYDPRIDPQLEWAGKAERTSFEVDAVSIHVHERLSTQAIMAAVKKEPPQLSMFSDPQLERDKEIGFYEHEVGWTNRLIVGDSLVVMTSLLERERMGGQVQCIYLDPPYGINYNSNFQADIANRSPRETDDGALTREPEQIQAYRDTWTLGVHSYLTYLRDRLLLAKELLADEGSIFVQIGPDRMHLVRAVLDEVFRAENAVTTITMQKTTQARSTLLPEVADYLLWYARDKSHLKYRPLYIDRKGALAGTSPYTQIELVDGSRRPMSPAEKSGSVTLPRGSRVFAYGDATSQGFSPGKTVEIEIEGATYFPGSNRHWTLRPEGMLQLARLGRLEARGGGLSYVKYADEQELATLTNVWTDTVGQNQFGGPKRFIVQTALKAVARCVLMTTDPGDLVLDPTCGSGTTAHVAEQWGRRWITMDTSRVAVAIARERMLTASFPYYVLHDATRGIDGGIRCGARPWIKPSTLGYEGEAFEERVLYDQPEIDNSKVRVSGPFTVEALSRYAINPMHDDVPPDPGELTATADHVDQILAALRTRGIPVKVAEPVAIATLSRSTGTSPLHGEGMLDDGRSFAVSVGPRYGPITVAQVDEALDDAYGYDLVVFAGFAATAEAQNFLAPGRRGRFDVVLLEASADLLLGDLLRNTQSSQTFRLFAAPDATATPHPDGGVFVELKGVDLYDAAKGEASSRSRADVAAWFLDHDYDGEVFHVCQAFFPKTSGWANLARALKGTLDEDALAQLATFQSNPFTSGEHERAAVRVVDFAGQTSETIVPLS